MVRAADTFETWDFQRNKTMLDAVRQCKKVAEGKAWSAFMLGSTGNGKTHLAIAAMHVWADAHDGRGVYFWKVPDLLGELRRRLNEGIGLDIGEALTDTMLSEYRHGDWLLVLDDLGTENPTDWACEKLYQILDSRADEQHPTIITSNARVAQIDGRIRSRFRAGLVACGGEDVR